MGPNGNGCVRRTLFSVHQNQTIKLVIFEKPFPECLTLCACAWYIMFHPTTKRLELRQNGRIENGEKLKVEAVKREKYRNSMRQPSVGGSKRPSHKQSDNGTKTGEIVWSVVIGWRWRRLKQYVWFSPVGNICAASSSDMDMMAQESVKNKEGTNEDGTYI